MQIETRVLRFKNHSRWKTANHCGPPELKTKLDVYTYSRESILWEEVPSPQEF